MATDNENNLQRRLEDQHPDATIAWDQPGAPAVPLSSTAGAAKGGITSVEGLTNKLHNEIMNLPPKRADHEFMNAEHRMLYKNGHRDARHAAAELVIGASIPLSTAPAPTIEPMHKDVEWLVEAAEMARKNPEMATQIRAKCKVNSFAPAPQTDERAAFMIVADKAGWYPRESQWMGWKARAALVAAPAPQTDELRQAVRTMARALENGEWADLLTTDEDAAALEHQIQVLVRQHNLFASWAAPAPQQGELSTARIEEFYGKAVNAHDTTRHIILDFARAIEREVKAAQAAPSAHTDLSHRLRETADQQPGWKSLLTAAADEIERYYGGMMAWKQTAEAKDREFAASKAAPSAKAEPVAYLYEWIGKKGLRRPGALIARTLDELGGNVDLYPTSWKSLGPLYTAPAPAVQAEDVRNQALEEAASFIEGQAGLSGAEMETIKLSGKLIRFLQRKEAGFGFLRTPSTSQTSEGAE